MTHQRNYDSGFYAVANPYHDFLLKALRRFNFVDFSDSEFWTLGGKEWHEFDFLVENGIIFGQNSYHNVDCCQVDQLDDLAVQAHIVDFFDIHLLWKRPVVVNFDSTTALVESNQNKWQDLIGLGLEAARLSGRVLLCWNFLMDYARVPFHPLDNGLYQRWLEMLVDAADVSRVSIDLFPEGLSAPKDGSITTMLAGCCELS